MTLSLYAHPFSSYCQKVLIALYENATPFELRLLGFGPDADERITAEFARLWPLQRMPLLVDAGRPVMEATIIIEHLDVFHRGRLRFIPDDARAALDVRTMDRFFDNYVMTPMQRIVFDAIRKPAQRDPAGVADARALLDTAYRWLDGQLADREWAAGSAFSLADCAAAPALLYADWAHPIAREHARVRDYRSRLLARPSYARAVDEARPYRANCPLGDPGRD
jgi:glutathione S-transferase